MEILIEINPLVRYLTEQIPEARQEFQALPREATPCQVIHKLTEVTALLLGQNRFRAVKHCLLAAEGLLSTGRDDLRAFIGSVYVYRLGQLIDRYPNRSEVLLYLFPRQLRAEYNRQIHHSLP